jgi:hypothetical protein
MYFLVSLILAELIIYKFHIIYNTELKFEAYFFSEQITCKINIYYISDITQNTYFSMSV